MRTTLEAEVKVYEISVLAELAVLERRPEFGLLCAAAKQGALTPEAMDQVLPGLSEMARANLRRHCEELLLCDREGRLTALGHQCASGAEVPVPEQGLYRFWVARHPCFGERLLHFRRERSTAARVNLQPLPAWFRAEPIRPWTSVIDPALRFCVRELPAPPRGGASCLQSEAPSCKLLWKIDLRSGSNDWSLEGSLSPEPDGNKRVRFSTPPEQVAELDTLALFASWDRRWDARKGRIAMDYDGDPGRGTGGHPFQRVLRYPRVTVPERGEFQNVEVLEVPVGPSSTVQAQRWAEALLLQRVVGESGYVSTERAQKLFGDIVTGSPLEEHGVRFPSHDTQLQALEAEKRRRAYWMLAAPYDLVSQGSVT
ncbi:MAG TPA: hypothetical protein VF794_40205 [Archangium sp.]|jgi:hypothetical protein|uniref:hypothetical protein n=1 Tax=Archangium sp. TaxID=1872627 RepID=UPI002ED9F38D